MHSALSFFSFCVGFSPNDLRIKLTGMRNINNLTLSNLEKANAIWLLCYIINFLVGSFVPFIRFSYNPLSFSFLKLSGYLPPVFYCRGSRLQGCPFELPPDQQLII